MKKWTRWGIVLLCAVVVAFGVRSIAGVSNADEASPTVTGTVKTVDAAHEQVTVTIADGSDKTVPLSKTVWVFLDNHKAKLSDIGTGFKVDLILNGKNQAAYIKAVSVTVEVKPAGSTGTGASGTAAAAPTSSAAAPTAPAAGQGTPPAAPAANASPAAPQSAVQAAPGAVTVAPWDTLHIKIEGKGFKLDIHDKGDHNNGMSMIKMIPNGRDGLFLKGDEAEHWIRTLLAGIDLKSPNAKQQIAAAFANWFELSGNGLNVNIEIEANTAAGVVAPASAPAAPATAAPVNAAPATAAPTTAAVTVQAPAAQITVSQKAEQEDEDDDNDKADKQEHDDHDKADHVKIDVKQHGDDKGKEKEHHGNGKHKGGEDD